MRKEATRAIIYARFSTDRQNEKSVDDQIALCAARCAREGWEVVDSFSDRAVSGSTPVAKRVGGAKMLAALMAREAADRSDRVVITSDNPRFEEPQSIIDDMLAGLDAEQAAKTISIARAAFGLA